MNREREYTIKVDSVSKSLNDTVVLNNVSVEFKSGNIYGLIGHNGSGKTVLFKAICGFLRCDKGSILINNQVMGRDLNMLTDAGVIIEEPAFLRNWRGYRNLEFLYKIRNKKKQAAFIFNHQKGRS